MVGKIYGREGEGRGVASEGREIKEGEKVGEAGGRKEREKNRKGREEEGIKTGKEEKREEEGKDRKEKTG